MHAKILTVAGIQGFKVRINKNGSSEGRYVVYGLSARCNTGEKRAFTSETGDAMDAPVDIKLMKNDFSNCMKPDGSVRLMGSFSVGTDIPVFQPSQNSISWVKGHVPISNPVCGLNGNLCRPVQEGEIILQTFMLLIALPSPVVKTCALTKETL